MKKYWMLGMVLVWLLSAFSVKADLIWEPMGDAFYYEHASECEYTNRTYTTNGPEGKVIVYVSPEDATEVTALENERKVHIYYIYTDEKGGVWGNCDFSDACGWIPMDYMEVVYDWISFEEDYGAVIENREGRLSEEYVGETIYIWDYPGCPEGSEYSMQYLDMPAYDSVYMDEEGRRWGKIGYYYGWRDCWICLDAPTASFEELFPEGSFIQGKSEVMETEEGIAGTDASETEERDVKRIVPASNNQMVMLVVGIVAAVVVITGVLLMVWKHHSQK